MIKKTIATLSVAAMLATTTFASMAEAGPRHTRVYHGHHKTVVVHKHRRHHRGFHRGHRRRGGKGAAVAAGVLGGILLGSVISDARRRDRYESRAPRTVYVPQPVPAYEPPVYQQPAAVVPPVRQQAVVAPPVQPQAVTYVDPTAHPFQGAECLQVREYQTTILIGGREVPAYGQACLRADGAWLQGPAQPEPAY